MRGWIASVALVAVGCGPQVATVVGDSEGSTGEASESSASRGDDTEPPGEPVNAVDILLVIDNSGSMAEEQATLSDAFGVLVDALESRGTDYRIGITTTDNGNPWCDGTEPENGRLVTPTSCRSRPEEFVFNGASVGGTEYTFCLEDCPEEWSEITLTDGAAWLHPGNLPEGLSMTQALRCIAPQGIAGCGFESHLQSLGLALQRSVEPNRGNFAFLREDTPLAILVLTDEADCSSNPDHEEIFLPEGNRIFWANPEDAAPTSAVCWNAGVSCTGDACESADLDVNGNPVSPEAADSDAVLVPVARYATFLQDIENGKRARNPKAEVFVAVIAGVASDGSVVYADAPDDPGFQADFGIGPGCESSQGRAVPIVRLREIADAFTVDDARNRFSVCDEDYRPAMQAFADAIGRMLP